MAPARDPRMIATPEKYSRMVIVDAPSMWLMHRCYCSRLRISEGTRACLIKIEQPFAGSLLVPVHNRGGDFGESVCIPGDLVPRLVPKFQRQLLP